MRPNGRPDAREASGLGMRSAPGGTDKRRRDEKSSKTTDDGSVRLAQRQLDREDLRGRLSDSSYSLSMRVGIDKNERHVRLDGPVPRIPSRSDGDGGHSVVVEDAELDRGGFNGLDLGRCRLMVPDQKTDARPGQVEAGAFDGKRRPADDGGLAHGERGSTHVGLRLVGAPERLSPSGTGAETRSRA